MTGAAIRIDRPQNARRQGLRDLKPTMHRLILLSCATAPSRYGAFER
jgi:hypothetical protein